MSGKKNREVGRMGKCCTVGNTEIVDEAKRQVRCKVCGSTEIFDEESFRLLKSMLFTIEHMTKVLEDTRRKGR